MITTKERIDKHYRIIEILEAIKYFEIRKETLIDNLKRYGANFSALKKRYSHELDIQQRAINRLESKLLKLK